MRKRTLGVVLVAGLAISGAGASTASNTVTSGGTAGYGTATVSGGTVNSIKYVHDDATATVTDATFIADGDWGATLNPTAAGSVRFLNSAGTVLASWDCTPAAAADLTSGDTTFDCVSDGTDPAIADVATVGITLTK